MAGKEIKIHIVSALNAAGINATKSQVDSMVKHVEKANQKMADSTAKIGGAMTKLEGPFGKMQSLFSGTMAKGASLIAAFKVGWDIGTWLNDKVITPLFGIKDPIEELKKKNRELKKEAEDAAEAFGKQQEKFAAMLDRQAKNADHAVQKIDQQTAAYIRMQKALDAVAAAGEDAASIRLQRDKFEDMTTLSAGGNFDAAAQAGKYYDVLQAEMDAKHKIARADADILNAEDQLAAKAKAVETARKTEQQAVESVERARRRLNDLENGDAGSNDKDKWDVQMDRAQKALQKAQDNVVKREQDRINREQALAAEQVEVNAQKLRRQNIVDAVGLEIDERKKAYDDFLDEYERRQLEIVKKELDARRAAEAEASNRNGSRFESEFALLRDPEALAAAYAERQQREDDLNAMKREVSGRNLEGYVSQVADIMRNGGSDADVDARLKSIRGLGGIAKGDIQTEQLIRTAAAYEARSTNEQALQDIARNTQALDKKLDELLAIKG